MLHLLLISTVYKKVRFPKRLTKITIIIVFYNIMWYNLNKYLITIMFSIVFLFPIAVSDYVYCLPILPAID